MIIGINRVQNQQKYNNISFTRGRIHNELAKSLDKKDFFKLIRYLKLLPDGFTLSTSGEKNRWLIMDATGKNSVSYTSEFRAKNVTENIDSLISNHTIDNVINDILNSSMQRVINMISSADCALKATAMQQIDIIDGLAKKFAEAAKSTVTKSKKEKATVKNIMKIVEIGYKENFSPVVDELLVGKK